MPCELRHADFFLYRAVIGAIGRRREVGAVGFWLGAPHRGKGLMTEAVVAVTDWLASVFDLTEIAWGCVAGNAASASVSRKSGFEFTVERPNALTFRDSMHPDSWHGVLRMAAPRIERPGWPL